LNNISVGQSDIQRISCFAFVVDCGIGQEKMGSCTGICDGLVFAEADINAFGGCCGIIVAVKAGQGSGGCSGII
jgi:hypothetical protein